MSERCRYCAEAAEAICLCEGRPSLMCTRCALKHSERSGVHDILPLEAELAQRQCSACRRSPAESLCLCAFPVPTLCAGCLATHSQKQPAKSHFCESLLAALIIRTDEDRVRFLVRAQALNRAETILKGNLVNIDKCKRDIELTTERIIEIVTGWMNRKTEELDRVREKLQEKVDEVLEMIENMRFESSFRGDGGLEKLLKESSQAELEEKLTIFKHFASPAIDLQLNRILYWSFVPSILESLVNVPEAPPLLGLPLVFYRQLRLFSLDNFTEKSFKLKAKVHINDGSSLCLLSQGDIFACGGEYPVHSLVYFLDPRDASAVAQPSLITARRFAGIIPIGNSVWVFGGNDEKRSIANSERYVISGRGSEVLGDMLSPREKFSPCQWGRRIVLAGGIGTTSVEMLDIDRKTYEPLPLRLPAADCTVSILRHSELVMIQANQLLVCDLDRPTVELRAHVSEGNWWTNLTPVIHNGSAFFFRLDFSLMFDRGLVDVLVSSFKKVVNIHRASLYALDLETLTLRDLRDIHY